MATSDFIASSNGAARQRGIPSLLAKLRAWRLAKIASPAFQSWASHFPLTRPFVRRSADQLYDLVSGFVQTQVLVAALELGVLQSLLVKPRSIAELSTESGLSAARMLVLCRAAQAIKLIKHDRKDICRLDTLGAACLGVPGLVEMIAHNQLLYRDCQDPVALLKGSSSPELARFWPYVLGAAEASKRAMEAPSCWQALLSDDVAERFSHLMAVTQASVARETLKAVPLGDKKHLLDVGGGYGVFLKHTHDRFPHLKLTLFDLPSVIGAAKDHLARRDEGAAIQLSPGSFLSDPLPSGADVISLIRVLYDHADATVATLLHKVYTALPPGGMLIISEPMSGGNHPVKSADVYFAFYTMAMETGRVRSIDEHFQALKRVGFQRLQILKTAEKFTTRVIIGFK